MNTPTWRTSAVTVAFFLSIADAWAVPQLQVGAAAGPGDAGIYADYSGTLTNPTEDDTAVTSGSTLYVAGEYATGDLQVGGQYTSTPGGLNWSDFGFNSAFDTHGAVLMATVPDGTLGALGNALTVNGNIAFYTTNTYESGFVMPNPPSNHDPVKNQDYLFFDVGNFASILDNTDSLRLGGAGIPNFVDESTGTKAGEIKTLSVSVTGFGWVHFDLFALITSDKLECPEKEVQGDCLVTELYSTIAQGNPGSKDVTWKPGDDDDDNTGGDDDDDNFVPEPGSLALFGAGLLAAGLGGFRRRRY